HLGLASLGTLHERVGEQMNIGAQPDGDPAFNGVWTRLIGEYGAGGWSGDLHVSAHDVSLAGIQGGADVYRIEHDDGSRDHAGIYAAYAVRHASISGFALGEDDLDVGKLTLHGPALGGYWTHYTPEGAYLDAVLQWNGFAVGAESN